MPYPYRTDFWIDSKYITDEVYSLNAERTSRYQVEEKV
jgi:hypothetical protein